MGRARNQPAAVTETPSRRTHTLNTDAFTDAVGSSRGTSRPEDDTPEHELLREQARAASLPLHQAQSPNGKQTYRITILCSTSPYYAAAHKDIAGKYEINGEIGFDQKHGVWTAATNSGFAGNKTRTVQASGPRLQPVLDELNAVMTRLTANNGRPMNRRGVIGRSEYLPVTPEHVRKALN